MPTRVDCHVKLLDERVVDRAISAGLDVLVYAPHFTPLPEVRATAARYTTDELLVVPAREVFTGTWRNRKHVLALGLEEPVPDYIPLAAAMAEFERQQATVLVPHPTFLTVSLSPADCRQYESIIDALEVFNPKHLPVHNTRARRLVDGLDCHRFTSSYAHLARTVGVAHTAFDARIDSEAALCRAIADGVTRRIVRASGTRRLQTSATELAHLAYENTWQKFDRVVRSGTEPTHPSQPVYDGRFEEVAYD